MKKTHKIVIKYPGQNPQIIDTKRKYVGECFRDFYDDRNEKVRIGQNLYINVSENGLPLDLPVNFLIQTKSPYYPIQKIVGPVVFIREKDPGAGEIWDYEVDDITCHDIAIIESILNDEYQNRLKTKFEDYGKGMMIFEILD